MAINSNMKEHVCQMRLTAEEWCAHVRVVYVSKTDTWLALNATIMKSMEYPLPSITIMAKNSSHILAPILDAGLSNSGICCTMNRIFVHESIELQGLGITNLYIHSNIEHILIWLQYAQSNSTISPILTQSLWHSY